MLYLFNHGLKRRNAMRIPLAVMSFAVSLSGLTGCASSPTALDQILGNPVDRSPHFKHWTHRLMHAPNLHRAPMDIRPVWWSSAITSRLNCRPSPFGS